MIHLDTNFVIGALASGSSMDVRFREWLAAEENVGVSTIVWAEFCCGPLSPEQLQLAQNLFPNPEPFLAEDALRAAELFNQSGRRRGSLADCMIAAVCIRCGASLATRNLEDFERLQPFGLQLLVL